MAKLFVRKGVYYITYSINGKRLKISAGTSDLKLARLKLRDIELKIFKGELGVTEAKYKPVLIPVFFRRYIEYAHNNYAMNSFAADLSRIRVMQQFFARKGVKYIHLITPRHLRGV